MNTCGRQIIVANTHSSVSYRRWPYVRFRTPVTKFCVVVCPNTLLYPSHKFRHINLLGLAILDCHIVYCLLEIRMLYAYALLQSRSLYCASISVKIPVLRNTVMQQQRIVVPPSSDPCASSRYFDRALRGSRVLACFDSYSQIRKFSRIVHILIPLTFNFQLSTLHFTLYTVLFALHSSITSAH